MQCEQSAVRALAMAAAVATAMSLGSASANAGDRGIDGLVLGGAQLSVNATLASDYRYRGFTQTQEKAALQGGLDVVWPHLYIGLWASSVDFGSVFDGGSYHDTANVELVSYIGHKRKLLGGELDLRATYFAYPGSYGVLNGASGTVKDLNYVEAMIGFSREISKGLTVASRVHYSPDYQGSTGQNWVVEGAVKRALGTWGAISPSFSATLGSSFGEESKGGIDYSYWNAGFAFVFADYFEFDLRYYDTFGVPTGGTSPVTTCNRTCDGRVVARITFEN